RRGLYSIFVLWAVSLVVFFVTRLSGDPTYLMVEPGAKPADIEALRTSVGLDRSWLEQYWVFVSGAVHGDFGNSLWQKQPSIRLILDRLPATLQLASASLLFSAGI